MESVIGKPLCAAVLLKLGLDLTTLQASDYTEDNIKEIVQVIVGHFKFQSSSANALTRFRRALREAGVSEKIINMTQKIKQSTLINASRNEFFGNISKTTVDVPLCYTKFEEIIKRVNKFIKEDCDYYDNNTIADLYIISSFPSNNDMVINITGKGKISNCSNVIDALEDDENIYSSFVDNQTVKNYVQKYNDMANPYKILCYEAFERMINKHEITPQHLREEAFNIMRRYAKIHEAPYKLTDILQYHADKTLLGKSYFSPVTDRLEKIKALLYELDDDKLQQVINIVKTK